ncbi:hypothetical protein, conserved, partial [Leishmania donovani]
MWRKRPTWALRPWHPTRQARLPSNWRAQRCFRSTVLAVCVVATVLLLMVHRPPTCATVPGICSATTELATGAAAVANIAGTSHPSYINILDSQDRRTARPAPVFEDAARQYEEGEYVPEEPHLLPGLQIQRRTFTPAELLERFGDTDIIYSFVNGSEANHCYRKVMSMWCLPKIRHLENATYWEGGRLPPAWQSMMASNTPT